MSKILGREKFSDLIIGHIRKLIISGELKSGERIIETAIAKKLGVSQAPVREALRELEVMGVVKNEPYKGCHILPLDKKKLSQIYALRSMLECFAAEQAIENITDDVLQKMKLDIENMKQAVSNGDCTMLVDFDVKFHRRIIKSAGNIMLEKMWNIVGASHWSYVTINSHISDLSYFPQSHDILLEMIEKRDKEGVSIELKRHFDNAASFVLDNIKRDEDIFKKEINK